jgi:hypothetical protein
LNVVHDTSASPRRSTRVMGANPPPRASEDLPRLNRRRRGRTATAMLVPDTYAPTAVPSSAIVTDESSPRPMR